MRVSRRFFEEDSVSEGHIQDEIRLALEMLVRAYDPCISCSTHYLDVKFV